MKKLFGFFQATNKIVFNQRGNIDLGEASPVSDVEPAAEAVEDVSNESDDSTELEGDSGEPVELEGDSGEPIEVEANTEAELETEIQEAIEQGAGEKEVQSMIRKYNLKIDGEDFEQEVDLDNEEEMIRTLQLAKKSHKTMQEKAELERATSQFLQNIRSNPFKALKELDPEFDEMGYVAQFVEQQIEQNAMTPEQKEQARIKSEYEQLIAERDRLKQEADQQKRHEETQILVTQIKSEISKALESDDDLVLNDNNISLIAQEMARANENNVELTPIQALSITKKRIQKEYNQYSNMFKSTAVQKKYMGNELLEKLREDRAKVAQKQQQVKSAKINATSGKQPAPESSGSKVSISDILAGRASWEDYEE